MPPPGVLRVAPVTCEMTWSYLGRLATRYGMEPGALLPWWTWTGSRPRDEIGPRDDAEVLLNPAGRQLLAHLGGVGERDLARALPAFGDEPQPAPAASPSRSGEPAGSGSPAGRWKVASAGEHGPAAYKCALCTAARTGRDTVVVRYVAPWQRVCTRHQRWMLTAGDGHRHHHLDLRAAAEVAAAQRAWPKVARQAADGGADPGRVFALSHAVVCAWWEQAQAPQRGLVLGGPLHAGPLLDCMGAFTRIRRGQQHPNGYGLDPWWLRTDHRPASARVQLRALAEQITAARRSGSSSGAADAGPCPGGAPTVRRLFRDRYGRAAAYTTGVAAPGDRHSEGLPPATLVLTLWEMPWSEETDDTGV